MTVRKYSLLLANSSHKSIWELYILAKYGNFVLNIQNFEKTPQTFLNEYQKSNSFLKKNSSQTVLTPAIVWELFAKNQLIGLTVITPLLLSLILDLLVH